MIDVIIIAHDSEKNIEKLLLSLVNQKDFIKVILVDNGCNKKEHEILRFYSKKYKFKLLTLERYNIKIAKQNALNAATNDYVFFLGGNDVVPDNYFKQLYDENFDIILGRKTESKASFEDLISGNISPSIYGKLFNKNLLLKKALSNYEECEVFYKNNSNIKIQIKAVPGYVHNGFEYKKKEFSLDYRNFLFAYEQYRGLRDDKFKKIAIENMIKYGNKAYSRMISDKNKYKTELSKIQSTYICLNDDYGAEYDVKTFNKIKSGKMNKNNIGYFCYETNVKAKKFLNNVKENLKPINKKEQKHMLKINKKRKVKK